MEQKTSEFDKVLGAWDILVIAFGAMIGWGWDVEKLMVYVGIRRKEKEVRERRKNGNL